MSNTFLIADTHFQHKLMETHRPWNTINEHDEALIENWNKVVRSKDKVYHLGDFCMNTRALREVGPRLNGDKVLIKGNHDTANINAYKNAGFRDIRAAWPISGAVLTHIPIHPMSVGRYGLNIHGHLHDKKVMLSKHGFDAIHIGPDPRYFCVSVEQIDFTPISLDEIRSRVNGQR